MPILAKLTIKKKEVGHVNPADVPKLSNVLILNKVKCSKCYQTI